MTDFGPFNGSNSGGGDETSCAHFAIFSTRSVIKGADGAFGIETTSWQFPVAFTDPTFERGQGIPEGAFGAGPIFAFLQG